LSKVASTDGLGGILRHKRGIENVYAPKCCSQCSFCVTFSDFCNFSKFHVSAKVYANSGKDIVNIFHHYCNHCPICYDHFEALQGSAWLLSSLEYWNLHGHKVCEDDPEGSQLSRCCAFQEVCSGDSVWVLHSRHSRCSGGMCPGTLFQCKTVV
jgi:hypothetical protein